MATFGGPITGIAASVPTEATVPLATYLLG